MKLKDMYKAFFTNKKWDQAMDTLELMYQEDKKDLKCVREFQNKMLSIATEECMNLARRSYFMLAKDYFDDYCIALEWNREPQKRFYLPRRKQLKPLADALQRLEDGDIDILGISMPPGTGKTQTAIFYLTHLAGKNPNEPILGGSHSNSFLEGVYGECLRIMTDDEYCWKEIFPNVAIKKTDAKNLRIDLDKGKRFETLEFSSIGSGNAGKVRAVQLLYCDDLIDGIETAMSRDRLDKIWQQYTTDLRQRKQGDHCRELHIATRWSLHDPIGRLKDQYEDTGRAEFITCPALDENDESNFDYPFGIGFSTQKYHEQRDIMDEASWRALYMNEPIEREGVLYDRKMLKRYFGELPDGEPDAIIGVCDTKTTGKDFCVMLLAWKYGEDYYIHDCVCEDYAPDIVENALFLKMKEWSPQLVQFESNVAGGKLAEVLQDRLKQAGCRTKITTKWTQQNKETKIQVNAPWVLEHCIFRDDSCTKNMKEYRTMINQMCSYTLSGKNKHDDTPDALAQLALYAQNFGSAKAVVLKRPFWL